MTQPQSVAQVLAELEAAPAEAILSYAATRFPGRVAFATSLGLEDQVLTHMISAARLDIPIFTLDTGRLYPETYDLIERTVRRYDLPLNVYFPSAAEVEEMVARGGVNLFRNSVFERQLCCETRKVKPLRRAQMNLDAWVCGLRSGQGATRQIVEPAEWDAGPGLYKINPLAAWDEAGVWDYVRAHDVPYNVLHDQGFPSIGCAPCTRAVPEGEDVRSGRWWWESAERRECGLHQRSAGAPAPPAAPADPGDGVAS